MAAFDDRARRQAQRGSLGARFDGIIAHPVPRFAEFSRAYCASSPVYCRLRAVVARYLYIVALLTACLFGPAYLKSCLALQFHLLTALGHQNIGLGLDLPQGLGKPK